MAPTLYAPERGGLGETILSITSDFAGPSNNTAEAIIVPDTTFPANYFAVGSTIRGLIRGGCSNVVTTPGTLTYRVRMGTTTLSATAVIASRALGLDTTAQTLAPWELRFEVVCRSIGTGGTALFNAAVVQFNQLASTPTNLLPILLPTAGSNTAQTVNTTVANILSVSAQFSVNTAGTNITSQEYVIESIA